MSLTLGREGGIAKPLKKRTVGQINIAHVYDGVNHIWPTSVIHFSDFTSVQLRYIWGSDDGRDLDTKSYYVNSPIDNLNYIAVGWSWNLSQIPYLYWGGDNLLNNQDYVNNYNALQSMVQAEVLNLVRGKIEASADGKHLLEEQLKLVKLLKSKIVEVTNKEMELFKAFKEASKTNPNLTYEEFLVWTNLLM